MNKQAKARHTPVLINWRLYMVLGALGSVFIALASRAAYIQVVKPDRLLLEGDLRSLRTQTSEYHRGLISDRNGIELAISVPVQAVWADPKEVVERDGLQQDRRWRALEEVLGVNPGGLKQRVTKDPGKRFVYLQRQVSPAMANYVRQLDIPGVYLKSESRRFYPTGEVSAQLVGFTDIDDKGQEGIERTYNEWLTGEPSKRRVRKDRSGRIIESLQVVQQGEKAQNLQLSIDQRIQALAYQELKIASEYHHAASGSVVVIDIDTGEVLAMVNTPSFNPNDRRQMQSHRTRNRAISDTFEPGSTVKPLAVLSALDYGSVKSNAVIDTDPGFMRIGGRRVQDSRNYGPLNLAGVLQKSSNVGVSKLALSVPVEHLLGTFYSLGFGNDTGIGLVGESSGVIHERRRWSDFEIATLSFGYGMTVTPLQLAQAYSVLGSGGILRPLSITRLDTPYPGERVLSESMARQLLEMMESVTQDGGTGTAARVPGYRVAGKTGTSRKAVAGGYGEDYVAIFAGVAPLDDPKLAIAVVVNEPGGDRYYGGDVAAPVFSKVMAGALRMLNVSPDGTGEQRLASLKRGANHG